MHVLVAVVAAISGFYGPGPEQEGRLSRLRAWQALPLETRRAIVSHLELERSAA